MALFVLALALAIAGSQAVLVSVDELPYTGAVSVFGIDFNFKEEGRISAMVFDDHGHSPFNFYDGMSTDGNCIIVTVEMLNRVLNVTVACDGMSSAVNDALVCPTWSGSQQWRASQVIVRKAVNRLTVEGSIPFNKTHKIYGNLQIDQMVMTKKHVVLHPNAVEFSHERECTCHFRNEFVLDLSESTNVEQRSLGYCYWQYYTQSWIVIYLSSVAGLFSIGLSAYLVIRLAIWRMNITHVK